MASIADWLLTTPEDLDWLYLSPAAAYGAHNPAPARDAYRLGGDVASVEAQGSPQLSAPDFAAAVVDLIESDDHHREHLSVTA